MKRLAAAALLISLAACATPRQQCISSANAEYRSLAAQAETVRGNIARGYAVHSQNVPYTYLTTCHTDTGDTYPCRKPGTRVKETPVAIDVAEERRKLARIEARMGAIKPSVEAAIAQCQALHPE